jgi:hypothetical protein
VVAGANYAQYVARDKDEQQDNLWVLETQTKGTGANMVPLDRTLKRSEPVKGFNIRKPEPRAAEPPPPREPYRFRLVDVSTRQVLADDIDARAAVQALEGVRSIVDVYVYVWEPEAERWRMLSFAETRALWDRRGRVRPPG